jgi:hypothetical protein
VLADDRLERGAVERGRDLVEAQPEPPQRDDPGEPLEVVRPVAAMARVRPLLRRQQAELVVVVQRANRQAGSVADLADAEEAGVQGHGEGTVGPHVT